MHMKDHIIYHRCDYCVCDSRQYNCCTVFDCEHGELLAFDGSELDRCYVSMLLVYVRAMQQLRYVGRHSLQGRESYPRGCGARYFLDILT